MEFTAAPVSMSSSPGSLEQSKLRFQGEWKRESEKGIRDVLLFIGELIGGIWRYMVLNTHTLSHA